MKIDYKERDTINTQTEAVIKNNSSIGYITELSLDSKKVAEQLLAGAKAVVDFFTPNKKPKTEVIPQN